MDSAGPREMDCRRSIVGRAEAKIMLAFPENDPITITGRGNVYFAGDRPGGSDLFIQLPFGVPLSANLDLIVPIRSVSEGRIGTDLTVKVPEIASGYGLLRSLDSNSAASTRAAGSGSTTSTPNVAAASFARH